MGLFARIIEAYTFRTGKLKGLWVRLIRPDSYKHADWLRIHGGFVGIGPNTRVNTAATITDPAYVRIGKNCALAKCDILGHNGVIGVLSNAYPGKLDSVGHTDVRDNSFVGHGAIILPGVTIGPNSIVASGAVVARDVPPGMIVGGSPAKVIGTVKEYHTRLLERARQYPWYHLIEQRDGDFDPAMEPVLLKMRVEHFYGHGETTADLPGGASLGEKRD